MSNHLLSIVASSCNITANGYNITANSCTIITYTANTYSQFTFIGCVACATVIWQWLLQATTVHKTFNDTEEYSLRSIAILGCNICSQITVAHVTLPKAVLSTVKIFEMYKRIFNWKFFSCIGSLWNLDFAKRMEKYVHMVQVYSQVMENCCILYRISLNIDHLIRHLLQFKVKR